MKLINIIIKKKENIKLEMFKREPVLKVCGLYATLNKQIILEDICLTIDKPGKIIGIIGPNGGGKTTFLKCLLGLIQLTKGFISIFGLPIKKARKYIGYIPQHTKFDYDFPINVFDVVLMGRINSVGLFRSYSNKDKNAVLEALKIVNLVEYSKRQIGQLSGGQRQRVFIARALVKNPKLLLMDEPTNGLDSFMQVELYNLLNKLKKKMSIIVVSHDFDTLSSNVDEIACLNKKIHFHDQLGSTKEDIMATYMCHVDLVTHKHSNHENKPKNHTCEKFLNR